MSSEKEQGKKPSSQEEPTHSISSDKNPKGAQTATSSTTASSTVPQSQQSSSPADKKPAPVDESTTYPSTPERPRPRQVIAVSASKGPAAFFNLARKFLVTDDMCDLSALEGAIVSAADAAHLLERSKLATIVRVQTSYVVVEPKQRRRNQPQQAESHFNPGRGRSAPGRDVRRARIVITVQRTESYKRWLEENPLQAVIAGDGDEAHVDTEEVDVVGSSG